MKYLEFSKPREGDTSAYPQTARVYDHAGGMCLDSIDASTAPNPLIPSAGIDKPNIEEYPIVHPGTYLGIFYSIRHHGRPCIALNDDGPVWILQDVNPRTGAERTAIGIRVHEGYKASWRGSAGCMTLKSPGGDEFLNKHFKHGEQVSIFIPDQTWFSKT